MRELVEFIAKALVNEPDAVTVRETGGDSGSVIVVAQTREAIALLFAGGDVGGSNGKGLTYAHPLRTVLDKLKIDLA